MRHKLAGDITSWEPQVNFLAWRYRVISYCARRYPPSDVPDDPVAHSPDHLVEDTQGLLRRLGIERASVTLLALPRRKRR